MCKMYLRERVRGWCVCVVRKIVILKSLCLCIREEVFLKIYCQLCVCVCVLFCCCLTINSHIVSYRFTSNFQISALRRVMIFLLSLLFLTIKPSQSIDNGIGVSPPMGWRSWNQFQCNINQSLIEETYLLMTSSSRNDENVRNASYSHLFNKLKLHTSYYIQAPVWLGKNAVFPDFPNSKVRKSRIFPRGNFRILSESMTFCTGK